MTAETPERPRRDGPPTSGQVQTALYVIRYMRDNRAANRSEQDVLTEADLIVQAADVRDENDGASTDDRDD